MIDHTKTPFCKCIDRAEAIHVWMPIEQHPERGCYVTVARAAIWDVVNVCIVRGCPPDSMPCHMDDDLHLYIGGDSAAKAEAA